MRARAHIPGFTGVVPGAKVVVAGEQVGEVIGYAKVEGGLDVELELDDTLAAFVRSTIPPGSLSFKEVPDDPQD